MGLQDRDYMHDRRRQSSPFTPPQTKRSSLFVVGIFLALAVGLYLGYDWLIAQKVAGEWRQKRGVLQPTPGPQVGVDRLPSGWQRCVVNGQTVFSPSVCPSLGTDNARGMRPIPPATRQAPQKTEGLITLYHCKAYDGGTFWVTAHCNQHRALVDRMVDVPANLTFSQQVEVAEGRRRAAAALQNAPQVVVSSPALGNRRQCAALAQQIQHWDAMARQPQSAQMQDWIRGERHTTRDRQRTLRC